MHTIYPHAHSFPSMKWTHVNKFGEVDPNIVMNILIAPFAHAANLFLDTHLPLDDVLVEVDNILGEGNTFFHFHCASFLFSLKNHDGHFDRGSSGKSHDTSHMGRRKGLSGKIPGEFAGICDHGETIGYQWVCFLFPWNVLRIEDQRMLRYQQKINI